MGGFNIISRLAAKPHPELGVLLEGGFWGSIGICRDIWGYIGLRVPKMNLPKPQTLPGRSFCFS